MTPLILVHSHRLDVDALTAGSRTLLSLEAALELFWLHLALTSILLYSILPL